MKIKNLLAFVALLGTFSLFAQIQTIKPTKSLLQSGPMVGYSEMREVMLWVQTNAPAEVQIKYMAKESLLPDSLSIPVEKRAYFTNKVMTKKGNAYVAHLLADEVEPGYLYDYELLINGRTVERPYPLTFQSQALWQWRTDPPNFRMAIGSCSYINEPQYDRPGRPYGGQYDIFKTIHNMKPDAMMWLGDNTYLREVDWYSKTGIQKRYTHSRSIPEMQALLASTHNYAIWDDHDYGPNDSDRSFLHKDKTRQAFTDFWANPTYGVPGTKEGITSQFLWNDVHFFLMDNRWYRTPNDCQSCDENIYFSKAQVDWLIESLIHSKATFKVIATGGQVLSSAAVYENYVKLNKEERAYLIKRIAQEDIKNVIFLSGDRHHTELNKLVNAKGHTMYDFTSSPMTSGTGPRKESNLNRVDGTLVTERNFGTLDFSGPRKQRQLTMTTWSKDGKKLWEQVIQAE